MKSGRFSFAVLILGLIMLYAPTLMVIGLSFNDSRLAGVWTGFSLRWYGELFNDAQFLAAARNSLVIAMLSATAAAVLGTCAGLALARAGRFSARAIFGGLLTVPLVLPEVIIGLALLLLFVAVGVERGVGTVVIAHATVALTYVAYVVQARVQGLSRQYEEAAADLGAPPWVVFTEITLPMIGPAIGAGWLLAFVLSLDDLVIASFTAGPGATTLPMAIFSSVRLGVSPKVNALATVLVMVSGLCLALAAWLQTRRGGRLI